MNVKELSANREFSPIEDAVKDLLAGKMLILVDDEDRENEGDIIIAAEKVTPEIINFMATEARGLICLALTAQQCDQLQLPLMVEDNTSSFQTGFTVSIEAKHGVTTGISVHDRATTILAAIADDAKPTDLARPGHIFPLRSREGGTLVRVGQTEGSVDLCKIAGLKPSAVLCEIMNKDGTMARADALKEFAAKHQIRIITVKDIVKYRLRNESLVKRSAETILPTKHGKFNFIVYEDLIGGTKPLALYLGDIADGSPVLTRVHSQCVTGDLFGSLRCDCGEQMDRALSMIAANKQGVLIYLMQEGRGIGLVNKIKAYNLQDGGLDTVEANHTLGFETDLRDYGIGAQLLRDLKVRKLRLLTNNPRKVVGLDGYGIEIKERVPLICNLTDDNSRYLSTKQSKLGHLMDIKDRSG
ncbi:MAG: bifunctional 3,4-dihydroxy-2-butanone-4-phosphate synthase/GTP cyclohydrolase II [Nitrospinota bacterium]